MRLYRKKKRRFKKEEVQNFEILRDRNQVRKFHQGVNRYRKGATPVTSSCYDKTGDLITDKQKVGRNISQNC